MFLDGLVLEGKRLGRTSASRRSTSKSENEIEPDHGVYVTAVHIPSFSRTFAAVTNIGVRPTVYRNSLTTVESHLLDFTADVYREQVRLFFVQRLREERAFDSTMQLMTQIRRDVEGAREVFADRPIDESRPGLAVSLGAALILLLSLVVSTAILLAVMALIWFFDRYDREPLHLVAAVFLWGAAVAPTLAIVGFSLWTVCSRPCRHGCQIC